MKRKGSHGSGQARQAAAAKCASTRFHASTIQMSLRWFSTPSSALTKKIEEYANTGIIFVVSAGNESGDFGVGSPANAKNAITVGREMTVGLVYLIVRIFRIARY